jgi:GDSL-like lipase/acylhydrolase family protein
MERLRYRYHPVFGHQALPNVTARYLHEGGGYLVRTNAAGFRCDHEFEHEKPPNVFRVLLFGDSYTEGVGVSNQHRYGDLLESLVPQVEVFNFGLGGTGTDQQYLIYRELGAGLEYDAVVVGLLVENIRRVVARTREFEFDSSQRLVFAQPYFTLEAGGDLKLHNSPVPRGGVRREDLSRSERAHLADAGIRKTVARRLGPNLTGAVSRAVKMDPYPGYRSPRSKPWRLMKAILTTWAQDVAPKPFVVMPIPMFHYFEGTVSARRYRSRFRELGADPRIIVHDPWDDIMSHSESERRAFRFARDPHPTRAYHRVLAQSLAPVVERLRANQSARLDESTSH